MLVWPLLESAYLALPRTGKRLMMAHELNPIGETLTMLEAIPGLADRPTCVV